MRIWNNSYPNFQFKNRIELIKFLPNGSIDLEGGIYQRQTYKLKTTGYMSRK